MSKGNKIREVKMVKKRKRYFISIAVSKAELREYREKADAEGVTLSQYFRQREGLPPAQNEGRPRKLVVESK